MWRPHPYYASNFFRASAEARKNVRDAIPSDSEDDDEQRQVDSKDFQVTLEPLPCFMDVDVKMERIIETPGDPDSDIGIHVKQEIDQDQGVEVTIKMEEEGLQEPDSTSPQVASSVQLEVTAAKLAKELEEEKKKNESLQAKLLEVYGSSLSNLNEKLLNVEKKLQIGEDAAKLAKELEEERKKNMNLQETLLDVYAKKLKRVPQGAEKKVEASRSTSGGPGGPTAYGSLTSEKTPELEETLTSRTSGFAVPAHLALKAKRFWTDKMSTATSAVRCHVEDQGRKGRSLLEEKFKETGVDFLKAKQERDELFLQLKKVSKDGDEIKQKMAEEEEARRKLDQDREKLVQKLAEEREKLAEDRDGLVKKVAEDRDGLVKKVAQDREEVIRKLTEELEGMKKKAEEVRAAEEIKNEKLAKSQEDLERKLKENNDLLQKAVQMLQARQNGEDPMDLDLPPILELQVDVDVDTPDWNDDDGAASVVAASDYECVTWNRAQSNPTPAPAAAGIATVAANTAPAPRPPPAVTHQRMRGLRKGVHRCSCGQEFAHSSVINEHIIKEEPPKIKCPQCGEAFRRLVSLNAHLKAVHKVKKEHLNKAHCSKCDGFFRNDGEKMQHKKSCWRRN